MERHLQFTFKPQYLLGVLLALQVIQQGAFKSLNYCV